jgi:hypothetical protein
MPRLIQLGADKGKLIWVQPTYQMIQQVLTSRVYAGAFVYGRRKLEMTPGDPPVMAERRRPVEEWDIVVPDIYPAHLSYDQFSAIVSSCTTTCITSPRKHGVRRGTGRRCCKVWCCVGVAAEE